MNRPRSLLPFSLLLLGCAHYQMACPQEGGPHWIEVISPHFTMRTDLPRHDAELLIAEQERMVTSFVEASEFFLPFTAAVPRTAIVLFDQFWEYERVVTSQTVGRAFRELGRMMPADERGRATVVISRTTGGEVFRHELTHRLLRQRVANAPLWLEEGLAEYLAQIYAQGGKVYLGGISRRLSTRNEAMRRNRESVQEQVWPLADVLDERGIVGSADLGYLSSWALVHYLANGSADHAERFRRFLAAVTSGRAAALALEEQYGPVREIEAAYRAQFWQMSTSNKALQWTIPYTASAAESVPVETRRLDDGEVHVMKAALRPNLAPREIALARAHAPDSPALHHWLALAAEARNDEEAAGREIEAAVASAVYDERFYRYERARLRLGHELRRPLAQRQLDALAAEMLIVARFVEEPQELDTVAQFLLARKEGALGRTFAERAVALDPQCASCLVTLAGFYFASGELENAVAAQEAAVQCWPRGRSVPAEVSAQLLTYRCARIRVKDPDARCP